jgi:hypothetical protein
MGPSLTAKNYAWSFALFQAMSESGFSSEERSDMAADLSAQLPAGLRRWFAANPAEIIPLRGIPDSLCTAHGAHGVYCSRKGGRAVILLDARQPDVFGTFVHEFGHHLHRVERARVDSIIQDGFSRIRVPSCGITATSRSEFFAETLYASVCRADELEERDAIGAKVVRDVLAVVGVGLHDGA